MVSSSFGQTFGVLLIGTLLSTGLYGLTSHQTYRYFRRFPIDRWSLKTLVSVLWIADTCFTAASFHWCFHYFVEEYGHQEALLHSTWSIRMGYVLTVITGKLSNLFYVSRLHMMGLNKWVSALILIMTILPRFAFEVAIGVKGLEDTKFEHIESFRWMLEAAFGFSAASNTTLAGALSYVLKQKRTGHAGTDSKIDVLVIYTVNTGLLSGILCFVGLFGTVFLPHSFLYLAVLGILTKIYVNSVLAVLNSRRTMHKIDESVWEFGAFEPSWKQKQERQHHLTFTRDVETLRPTGAPSQMGPIQINVSETKTMHVDDGEASIEMSKV